MHVTCLTMGEMSTERCCASSCATDQVEGVEFKTQATRSDGVLTTSAGGAERYYTRDALLQCYSSEPFVTLWEKLRGIEPAWRVRAS